MLCQHALEQSCGIVVLLFERRKFCVLMELHDFVSFSILLSRSKVHSCDLIAGGHNEVTFA